MLRIVTSSKHNRSFLHAPLLPTGLPGLGWTAPKALPCSEEKGGDYLGKGHECLGEGKSICEGYSVEFDSFF